MNTIERIELAVEIDGCRIILPMTIPDLELEDASYIRPEWTESLRLRTNEILARLNQASQECEIKGRERE